MIMKHVTYERCYFKHSGEEGGSDSMGGCDRVKGCDGGGGGRARPGLGWNKHCIVIIVSKDKNPAKLN